MHYTDLALLSDSVGLRMRIQDMRRTRTSTTQATASRTLPLSQGCKPCSLPGGCVVALVVVAASVVVGASVVVVVTSGSS